MRYFMSLIVIGRLLTQHKINHSLFLYFLLLYLGASWLDKFLNLEDHAGQKFWRQLAMRSYHII